MLQEKVVKKVTKYTYLTFGHCDAESELEGEEVSHGYRGCTETYIAPAGSDRFPCPSDFGVMFDADGNYDLSIPCHRSELPLFSLFGIFLSLKGIISIKVWKYFNVDSLWRRWEINALSNRRGLGHFFEKGFLHFGFK